MHDGKKQSGTRPSFISLVKESTSGRASALAATLPFPLDGSVPQGEEMSDITSPETSHSPVCDRGTLTMVSGAEAGSVFRLSGSTTIGRAPECEIQIDHAGVSRRHARIVR